MRCSSLDGLQLPLSRAWEGGLCEACHMHVTEQKQCAPLGVRQQEGSTFRGSLDHHPLQDGATPLLRSNDLEVMRLLLDRGANKEATDRVGAVRKCVSFYLK